MIRISEIAARFRAIKASMVAVLELPAEVAPRRFKRTDPTPYIGRAKFRVRVKLGEGLDCFEDQTIGTNTMVVQLPPRVWKVAPEIAGHVIASQIGNASRRNESSVLKRVTWG